MADTLGIIVARGGSKSIPKKSIAFCAGHPLLYYTAMAARHATKLSRIIISTDDQEIADYAGSIGIEVPFLRPKELAEDATPDLPVFQHALTYLRESENYMPEAVVHLRPTTPLKASTDIDIGVGMLLANSDADSVRSVCEPAHTPFKMYRRDGEEKFLTPLLSKEFPDIFQKYPEPFNMPRQSLPKVWRHSGYVDVIRSSVILEQNSMSGQHIMPLMFDAWRDIDIDTPKDLQLAELVIKDLQGQGKNPWGV